MSSNPALYAFDAEQRARFGTICGVDEARQRASVRTGSAVPR